MNDRLMRRYSIDLDQYEWFLEKQKGVCLICRQPETRKSKSRHEFVPRLSVDHDKRTKVIRGLLCHNCNVGIGSFKHNVEILEGAIKYIERWNSLALDAVLAQANESKREAK